MSDLNLNQREQVAIAGQLDLQISRSGIISGVVAASETGGLAAGQSVKLDSSNTGAEVKFVACAYDAVAIGFVIRDIQKSVYAAGDAIQVAGAFGPVMFLVADETITAGEVVEINDSTGYVRAASAGKKRGIAIDHATVGQLTRVIISTPDTAL